VTINGVSIAPSTWSDTQITTYVPQATAGNGNLTVVKYNATSNATPFTVTGKPTITGYSAPLGGVGSTVAILGSGFWSSAIQQHREPEWFPGNRAQLE
jgi:hypothetical protein